MKEFDLQSKYKPTGDQPEAIRQLTNGVLDGTPAQVLLGVTGSGKTFTIANVIKNVGKPTLVLSHNKTLAAQLYSEFKGFFPNNAVEYYVSYYDYYQPEAYIASTDTYIEKDLAINEDIDKLRLAATSALLSGRNDVIVVSSVSCIYGMGNPAAFYENVIDLKVGKILSMNSLLNHLVSSLYTRNDVAPKAGNFRVKGDTIDIYLAYADELIRVCFWDDEIDSIEEIDAISGTRLNTYDEYKVYPANLFLTSKETQELAIRNIQDDLCKQVKEFEEEGKTLEAKRLKQIRAMYGGDRSRKESLVNYGFRLPAALDNRPLKFDEFHEMAKQVIYISATPAEYELKESEGVVVDQVIRPTGLLDPPIEVRDTDFPVDDLMHEIHKCKENEERVLVTTLTKRMAEELTDYLLKNGINTAYIHSDVDTLERVQIMEDLRRGIYDVLVGVNLLREGLDLPEVALVAILDADKEGFLRCERSLTQTAGRAARNVNGRVIMYAKEITQSMQQTIDETNRRRTKQIAYNMAHHITPQPIFKPIESNELVEMQRNRQNMKQAADASHNTYNIQRNSDLSIAAEAKPSYGHKTKSESIEQKKERLQKAMKKAAADFDFILAAQLRDELLSLDK